MDLRVAACHVTWTWLALTEIIDDFPDLAKTRNVMPCQQNRRATF